MNLPSLGIPACKVLPSKILRSGQALGSGRRRRVWLTEVDDVVPRRHHLAWNGTEVVLSPPTLACTSRRTSRRMAAAGTCAIPSSFVIIYQRIHTSWPEYAIRASLHTSWRARSRSSRNHAIFAIQIKGPALQRVFQGSISDYCSTTHQRQVQTMRSKSTPAFGLPTALP